MLETGTRLWISCKLVNLLHMRVYVGVIKSRFIIGPA